MGRKRTREQIFSDRAKIAEMSLFGNPTHEQISEKIGIDRSTVTKELKKIRQNWQESAERDIAEIIANELKKLDEMEIEIIGEWEKSKKDWQKRVVEEKGGGKIARIEQGGSCGDPRYMTALIQIQDRRAKLYGLDKPTKIAPTTPNGKDSYKSLTDDELLLIASKGD